MGTAASAAALVAALLTAGCGVILPDGAGTATPSASSTAGSAAGTAPSSAARSALGFRAYRGAVQWPAKADAYVPAGLGLEALVPDGHGCVLGVGVYRTGYQDLPARWVPGSGCTRLALDPPPGQGGWEPGGGAVSVGGSGPVVLRWTDGSLISVADRVSRTPPSGRTQELASLNLPVPDDPRSESADRGAATAAVQVGRRLLIGGGERVAQVEHAVVWLSEDRGATLRRPVLPVPAIPGDTAGISGIAAHGGEVVAIGGMVSNAMDRAPNATGRLPIWHSSDAGGHWTVSVVPGLPAGAFLRGVLRLGDGWLAYGFTQRAGDPDRPVLLVSPDGKSWTRLGGSPVSAVGTGDVLAGTVDAAGRPVLVGSEVQPREKPDTDPVYCGAVWTADAGGRTGWSRGDLGCGAAPPQTAATLADGRVLLAGNSDLWLRAR